MAWWKKNLGLAAVASLAMTTVACGGAHGQAKEPMGHVEVQELESPDDAPENAKTVQVSYIFDRDVVNKDYEKAFAEQFDKKGIHVDEQLNAKAHFDVKGVKITGTVTYVKRRMGYSIIEADLVTEGHYDADVQVDLDVKVKAETPKQSATPAKPKKKGMFASLAGGNAKDGLIPTEAKLEESDFEGTALGGKPFTIVKNVMPTNIPIAGPLFLHAHFDLNAACDIGVEGQMHATTGVGIKGDVRLAAKYKKAGFEKADGKKSKFAFEAKTPNFELAPRPYLKVEGKQQSIKGRCSLQPTAVLLLEHSVGAKLTVEPWVEMDASRPNARTAWKLGTQAGVSVNAATDIEIFGRQMRKPKEFNLYEIALTKPADNQPSVAPAIAPTAPLAPAPAAVAVVAPSPAVKPEPVVAALLKTEEPKTEAPKAEIAPKTEAPKAETVALKTEEPAAPTTKASMPLALLKAGDKPEEEAKPEPRAETTEAPTKGRKKGAKPAAVNAADIMASATSSDAPAARDDDADATPKKKSGSKKLANISAGASKAGAIANAASKLIKKKR